MPRFAANLNWLYPEHALRDRFRAASEDGFAGVECLFPYDLRANELRQQLDRYGLQCVLINAPAGDWAAGERGLAALPGREDDFRRSLDRALRYATAAACPRIHVMAGVADAGPGGQADLPAMWATYVRNLEWAACEAAAEDITLTIEPINPRDMPGYLLNRQADAQRVISEVGAHNLRLQLDLYHCQMVEGEIMGWLSGSLQARNGSCALAHLQVAGVPERCEPDAGDVDYPPLFELIDQLGYAGWVGCEYRPRQAGPGGTTAGLSWLRPYLGPSSGEEERRKRRSAS